MHDTKDSKTMQERGKEDQEITEHPIPLQK